MKQLRISVEDYAFDALAAEAKAQGITISKLVRKEFDYIFVDDDYIADRIAELCRKHNIDYEYK